MILLYSSLVLSQLRKINWGTEKGKHKSKNHRTVGTTITFERNVLIINADTEEGLFYGFQQQQQPFLGSA